MIDTKELRRLAQEAMHPVTKGRWMRLFGERTVYDRMEDGCRGIPVVSTPVSPPRPFEAACLDFIAAANPAAVIELLDRLKAAEKENAKLREALAEKVTSETMLRDLRAGNGSINAAFEGGAVHLLVEAFADQFSESRAENYLEMRFHSDATGPLMATVQRLNGKTPHQLRAEAEKERNVLKAKIAKMEKQEPVWFIDERGEPKRYHKSKADYCKYGGLDLLYALPGAKGESE